MDDTQLFVDLFYSARLSFAKAIQTKHQSFIQFLNCMHNNDFVFQIKACHRLAKCKYAAHLIFTICLNFLVQTYLKWNQFRHFVVLCVFAVQVLTLLHEYDGGEQKAEVEIRLPQQISQFIHQKLITSRDFCGSISINGIRSNE